MIPTAFLNYSSDVLAETDEGLSGSKISEYCSSYAIDFNVDIPYADYPFPSTVPNKRTALRKNLKAFQPYQQFKIIRELCELEQFKDNNNVKNLKIKLISRYGILVSDSGNDEINEPLIIETKHWLSDYPDSLKLYDDALNKFNNKIFQRNVLDDLRLSLEKLLKCILNNNKPIEKQFNDIGTYIKERHGSKELSNMFVKLIDYYSKYQNTYVKHNDLIIENEIEFVIEITCSFLKFIIRIR